MKNLSRRTQELISLGLNRCGLHDPNEVMSYIEERLPYNQYHTVKDFVQWLYDTDLPYGSATAQERWREFSSGTVKSPDNYFDLKFSFKYNVCGFVQTARMSERMQEPTLEEAASLMMDSDFDSNVYTFRIVDKSGTCLAELDHEEVKSAVKFLLGERKKECDARRIGY